MKRNKTLAISLCLVLMFSALIGCSKTNEGENAAGSNTQATGSTTPVTESIRIPVIKLPLIPTDSTANVNGEVVKKIEEKLGIKIEMQPRITKEDEPKINIMIASGEIPDYIPNEMSMASVMKWIDQGILAKQDADLIAETMPKYMVWIKQYLGEDPFQYSRFNREIYTLPVVWTIGPNRNLIGYREDWREKLNIGIPESLEDYEAMLLQFVQKDPDGNGKKDTVGFSGSSVYGNTAVWGAYDAWPGIFYERDGKIVFGSIEPQAKEALAKLNEWYKNGILDKEFMINKADNVAEKWNMERVGSIENAWYKLIPAEAFSSGQFYKDLVKKNPDAIIGTLASEIKGPNGSYGVVEMSPLQTGLVFGKHLEKDIELQKAYYKYFEYVSFDVEGMELSQYGIKGTTFNFSPEEGVTWIPPYDKQEERDKMGIKASGTHFNDYELRAPYETSPQYLPIRLAQEKKGTGKYDILENFVRPIYNDSKVQLKSIEEKAIIEFITGERTLDKFDDFVNEWLDKGGQKVLEEANNVFSSFSK